MSISLKEKIGYGFGDMASSMFWKLFGMYLLFFYTDVFGISAAAVGTMFLVTRVWDALIDPIMGVISDRTQTKWGKFRPYLAWVAIPFGIVGVLTFTTPDWSMSAKLIYAYGTHTLMMMVYTAINVPYASLLGVITSDTKLRTTLATYRMLFAYLGSFIALLMIEPLVDFFSRPGSNNTLQTSWQYAVSIIAVMCIGLFFACFALTKERVKPIIEKNKSLAADVKDLFKNRPWWILMGAGIAALIFNSIRDGATIYYFKYYIQQADSFKVSFWSISITLTTFYLVVGQAGNMIGVASAAMVANRFGKKNTYMGAMVLATIMSVIFYWLKPDQLVLIFLLQALISMCAGIVFPLLWSMYADTADYSELKTDRRATGLIFSSSSMSQKLGWTIGGALTGWLLAYFGFQANTVQTEFTQSGIRMMLSFLPAAGTIMSIVFLMFYPLTEKKMEAIQSELTVKRGA